MQYFLTTSQRSSLKSAHRIERDRKIGDRMKVVLRNGPEILNSAIRGIVITNVPFIMFSSCTNGVAAYEDKHTGAQRRVYGDGGFDWAFDRFDYMAVDADPLLTHVPCFG